MPLATDDQPDAQFARADVRPDTHRRRALALFVIAGWNVVVWGTRMRNLLGDGEEHSAAFVAVHVVLYVTGFAAAAVLARMGWQMRREAASAVAP